MVLRLSLVEVTQSLDITTASSNEFFDIQAFIERKYTLKYVYEMIGNTIKGTVQITTHNIA